MYPKFKRSIFYKLVQQSLIHNISLCNYLRKNIMIPKKGFLLIEFVMGLFLLSLCITFFILQYAHIGSFTADSLQTHKKLMIIQSAVERARSLKKEYYELYTKDMHNIEITVTSDRTIKRFLHIMVTLYDKDKKKETWFSGVTIGNE